VSTSEPFRVRADEDGLRVEKFLSRRLDASWDHVGKLLRQGRVLVGEVPAWRGQPVSFGQQVVLSPRPQLPPPPQPNRKIRLRVLHDDPHVVVLAKPPRLAMHPGPGHGTDTLLNALVGRYPDLLELGHERGYGLVHRLDLDTSGVLAVARTPLAYDALVDAFRERRVEKEYLALLRGRLESPSGRIDTPLNGQDAATRYHVEERAGPVLLVRVWPETGRTHQIRLHMRELGAPVLHDTRHGRGRDDVTAKLYLGRLALHARRLAFPHPLGGELLETVVELPKDLRRAWQRAQKLWPA
jgi:23S rRNA pseudouridine1911/1915/1917 synthase